MRSRGLLITFFLIFFIAGSSMISGMMIEVPWSVYFGGINSFFGDGWGAGVAVSGAGDVYTTGDSSDWDMGDYGVPIQDTNGRDSDVYVAKWNKKGKLLWYTFLGSSNWDFGDAITTDREGYIYVVGSSYDSWNSGKYSIPVIQHNDPGNGMDVFVAKLSPDGQLIWHTFLGGAYEEYSSDIRFAAGSIFITGTSYYSWNTGVYGDPISPYNDDSFYSGDVFVAKLNLQGQLQWYTFLGSTDYEYANGLVVAPGGNIYVTGQGFVYWSRAKYGPPLTDKNVDDQPDGFIAKLNGSGQFNWYTFIGEGKSTIPYDIAYAKGRVIIAGSSDFGLLRVSGISSVSKRSMLPEKRSNGIFPSSDALVASYSLSGEKKWLKTYKIDNYSSATAIDVGPEGDIFLAGYATSGFFPNPVADVVIPIENYRQYMFSMVLEPNGYKKWIYKFEKYPFGIGNDLAAFKQGTFYITGNNLRFLNINSSFADKRELIFNEKGLFLVKINGLYTVDVTVLTGGGSVEKDQYVLRSGESCIVNMYPDPGYELYKIVDNIEEVVVTNPYIIANVQDDHIVDVYFRLIQYPPDLILTGARIKDNAWIIEKEFADLTITIIEHETSPMDVKAYVVFKYKEGIWKEITRFTESGTFTFKDKFLTSGVEEKYILKALAPDGTVIAETDILIL